MLRAGKSFASEILALVLAGLHVSEASLHFCFDDKIQGQVVNPIICEDCICRVHDLFGMGFLVQMSCSCGECFDEKEYSTVLHKLDAGSPQTTKIKSLADLPVILMDGSESHINLSEILIGRSPLLDITLLLKGVDPATKYALHSMICCSGGSYVRISQDQNKWVIYSTKTIEAEEDSWEHVLQRLTDGELTPEALVFVKVIKVLGLVDALVEGEVGHIGDALSVAQLIAHHQEGPRGVAARAHVGPHRWGGGGRGLHGVVSVGAMAMGARRVAAMEADGVHAHLCVAQLPTFSILIRWRMKIWGALSILDETV
ncbi:hypothetical protein GUJ93_ZPchr0011g27604 [Zizania palustris]|uniref:Uncharacterized protein n=1 Tax=Zizania palustris TaxID=103762 RepID=A0A8J5WF58_ZIZPA|nr:hypothetical protein GUJ93_ZPchr0011g27604 [Zizania palustris]